MAFAVKLGSGESKSRKEGGMTISTGYLILRSVSCERSSAQEDQ